jgi:hypothetical protein
MASREARRTWARRLAVAWLALSAPCWFTCLGIFENWESTGHGLRLCGNYPCDIALAWAMVLFIIPAGVVAGIATLVWLVATRARK